MVELLYLYYKNTDNLSDAHNVEKLSSSAAFLLSISTSLEEGDIIEKIKNNPIKLSDNKEGGQELSNEDIIASLQSLNKAMDLKEQDVDNTSTNGTENASKDGESNNNNYILIQQKGWKLQLISTVIVLILGTYVAFFV